VKFEAKNDLVKVGV